VSVSHATAAPGLLWESQSPEREQPVLLSGPRSEAILAGTGEFSWPRECRGARAEWAGVSSDGIRLVAGWKLRFGREGMLSGLEGAFQRIRVYRGWLESEHRIGGLRLTQRVYPVFAPPGVARELELVVEESVDSPALLEQALEPFLAPLLLEGVKPYEYVAEARGSWLLVSAAGSAFLLEGSAPPSSWTRDGAAWDGVRFRGELSALGASWRIEPGSGAPFRLRLVISGGLERNVPRASGHPSRVRPGTGPGEADAYYREWETHTPELSLPEAPHLEAAYRLARGALRSLYYAPLRGLTGLRAGLPWYSAIWGRDLAWALPAVLWMGDGSWAERSLRSVFDYQSPIRIPILGAEAGELPMQLSPGPVFLFGTSDTTLYYPGLVRRHFDHTGDTRLSRELAPRLRKIGGWLVARQDPGTGWIRNGGEVEALAAATEGLSSVRFGIDSVDTTIWDSTDRREHAIDVQVLGIEALRALAELERRVGESEAASAAGANARRLEVELPRAYDWPEERYLADSLRGGERVRSLRPNALRAVAAGFLSIPHGRAVVRRAAEEDLSTPWGLRTLSSRDARYDPLAYHDGQVWPVATAWAAEAALAVGERELGLRYLEQIARTLVAERGYANECYRGDAPEARNSCFLLGLSFAPFLSILFERLWGIDPELAEGRIHLHPELPPGWERASLRGVRLGAGRLDLRREGRRFEAEYTGPSPVTLTGPGGETSAESRSARLSLVVDR
jgi:amylo-alpha-1,6-glucosidase